MTAPFRVVFDTNAFMPGKFELLEQSPMRRLVRSGRIIPIYGHVFLDETCRAYGIENKRPDLIQRWSPFITETADRFCDDFMTIWHRELVQGIGSKTNIFMKRKRHENTLANLSGMPLDGSWHVWNDSSKILSDEAMKRNNFRKTLLSMRQEITDWLQERGYDAKELKKHSLDDYFDNNIDYIGRQFLHALVKCNNPRSVADRWSRAKMEYPYFTTFIRNMLYLAYHAMTKHNDKVDQNAQADLDLMTHLLHADAIVSNETKFLPLAFKDLWHPKGKVLLTSEQFVALITKF